MTLEDSDIRQLVRLAQNGDREAFSKIYDHFFPSVYRYAAFRLPAEVAEDLVAEIFVTAWEKLHTYKVQKNIPFSAWIFRIARHKVIDAYRSYQRWEEVPEEVMDPDDLNLADTKLKREETLKIVQRTMDKLPRRYRDVLHLSFFADLPHHEVARVLRLTEGAVRILKFRALKKFETMLPPDVVEKNNAQKARKGRNRGRSSTFLQVPNET